MKQSSIITMIIAKIALPLVSPAQYNDCVCDDALRECDVKGIKIHRKRAVPCDKGLSRLAFPVVYSPES